MTDTIRSDRLDCLVLARLLSGKKPPTQAAVQKDLSRFVDAAIASHDWPGRLADTLGRLEARGELERSPLRLTEKGQKRIIAEFGLTAIPPTMTWSQVKSQLLVAHALGVSTRDAPRIATADGLRGRVLREALRLPLAQVPTKRACADIILWRELGFDETQPLTLPALKAALLARKLGSNRTLGADRLTNLLVASAVGARNPDVDAVREAAVARWLGAPAAPAPSAVASPAIPIEEFAAKVLDVARTDAVHRFGPDKAFIGSIWQALVRTDDPLTAGGLDLFKLQLVEANRRELLRLSRADLVQAMDQVLVAQSETNHLGAVFHFVHLNGSDI